MSEYALFEELLDEAAGILSDETLEFILQQPNTIQIDEHGFVRIIE